MNPGLPPGIILNRSGMENDERIRITAIKTVLHNAAIGEAKEFSLHGKNLEAET